MEWFVIGFFGGSVWTAGIAAVGWFAHDRAIHKPAMRRAAQEHSNEVSGLKKRIGEMSERAREIERVENERGPEQRKRAAEGAH